MTLAQWRAATGQDTHSIVATPAELFVNVGGNDYHLSATSPARDAGATLATVTEDLEGAVRPQGTASDIGAYEFPAAATPVSLTVIPYGQRLRHELARRDQLRERVLRLLRIGNKPHPHGDPRDGLGLHGLVVAAARAPAAAR